VPLTLLWCVQTLATQINNFWLQSVDRYQIDSQRPVSLHHSLSPCMLLFLIGEVPLYCSEGGDAVSYERVLAPRRNGISCYQTEQEREVCERDRDP